MHPSAVVGSPVVTRCLSCSPRMIYKDADGIQSLMGSCVSVFLGFCWLSMQVFVSVPVSGRFLLFFVISKAVLLGWITFEEKLLVLRFSNTSSLERFYFDYGCNFGKVRTISTYFVL